jgi:hypothetical protein
MRKRGLINAAPLIALTGMAALVSSAWAQQPQPGAPIGPVAPPTPYSPSAAAAAQSGPAQTGGITLRLMGALVTVNPSLKVETRYDDNVFLSPTNRSADQVLVLTPALSLETRQANNTFALRMSTTIAQYQKNKADNYSSTNIGAFANLDLGTRLRANLSADFLEGVDPRGSNNNPLSSTPDRYRQVQGRGIFSYGAREAKGRIDFEFGQVWRNYTNNRDVTEAEDRAAGDIGATFNWRVGPKTTLLIQGKHTKVDYALTGSTLNSVEDALLAGAVWEASAKTRAAFRIGMVKKDFDDAAHASSKTLSWAGEATWSPRTYSRVNLSLNRSPAETTGGVGDYIDRTNTAASWTHDWSGRFTTEASAAYLTDAYQGVARTDNTQNYGLRATYKMRRWLSFGADYTHSNRTSDDSNFDYKRNAFMLFFNAAL